MKEVKITWCVKDDTIVKLENTDYNYILGNFFMEDEDIYLTFLTSTSDLNIDMSAELGEFYTEEQKVLNKLTDNYNMNVSIGELIVDTGMHFQDCSLILPTLNIKLVW